MYVLAISRFKIVRYAQKSCSHDNRTTKFVKPDVGLSKQKVWAVVLSTVYVQQYLSAIV